MWSQGLLQTIKNSDYVVYNDEQVVIIKDMYPKAKYHFLVVSNEDIAGIRDVNRTHLPLLQHMHTTAENYVKKNLPNIMFK